MCCIITGRDFLHFFFYMYLMLSVKISAVTPDKSMALTKKKKISSSTVATPCSFSDKRRPSYLQTLSSKVWDKESVYSSQGCFPTHGRHIVKPGLVEVRQSLCESVDHTNICKSNCYTNISEFVHDANTGKSIHIITFCVSFHHITIMIEVLTKHVNVLSRHFKLLQRLVITSALIKVFVL